MLREETRTIEWHIWPTRDSQSDDHRHVTSISRLRGGNIHLGLSRKYCSTNIESSWVHVAIALTKFCVAVDALWDASMDLSAYVTQHSHLTCDRRVNNMIILRWLSFWITHRYHLHLHLCWIFLLYWPYHRMLAGIQDTSSLHVSGSTSQCTSHFTFCES